MRRLLLSFAAVSVLLTACGSEETRQVAQAPAGARLLLTTSNTIDWQDVSAEITTVDQAQVFARIPGILTNLSVREGDIVRKGQLIGRVVDNRLDYQAEAFRAQSMQAQAELARVKYLHANGVYADARLDQAQAAASASGAQYAAANAAAGQGAVVAPASGRVLRADVPVGAPVAPGIPIAVITAGPTIVRLDMPESLADKVHVGAQVLADGQTTGHVTKVYPSVTAGQVAADVAMPGIDDRLIGRRIAARVETGTRKALLVPKHFVTTNYGIDYVTLLAKDGSASRVPVQTARTADPGKVEILSGASAGNTLIGASGK